MITNKRALGIVGIGVVGQAIADYYRKEHRPLFYFDKYKMMGSVDEVVKADIIFICLPTPTNERGGQDISAIEETLDLFPTGKTLIIKSTVLPGTTMRLQKKRPDLVLFHNPEFLDSKKASKDFAEPDLQILGCTDISRSKAEEVMALLPKAPHAVICSADESETVKYVLNVFMVTKNIFANQIYDYCQAKGINYDHVKDIVKRAPRMGGEVHLNIFMDGYRGYDGACLPKDTNAFIRDGDLHGSPQKLLSLVKNLNEEYNKQR